MPLAFALFSGLILVAAVVIFVVVLYRLAGIHPSSLERRRLKVLLVGFVALAMSFAVIAALEVPPGLGVYTIGFAVAGYFGIRQLQRNYHWLVTPTAEERALLPARRDALAAVRRRPVFWLLAGGFVMVIPILSVVLAIAFR